MGNKGMGGHQSAKMIKEDWVTPKWVLEPLGHFDLDPAAGMKRPWPTADNYYTKADNGLIKPWFGNVWLNPPYGSKIDSWMRLMADYGKGISLIFARTETVFFQQYVFARADSLFFFKGRITFCDQDGIPAGDNSGAPSVLIAYGEENVERLDKCGHKGKHVPLRPMNFVVVGVSPSWKDAVKIAIGRCNGPADLKAIYEAIEQVVPDKIQGNVHYREKVRQTLQKHFARTGRGQYTLFDAPEGQDWPN